MNSKSLWMFMLFFSIIMMAVALLRIGIDTWHFLRTKDLGSDDSATFNSRGIGGIAVSAFLIVLFGLLALHEKRKK